MNLLEAIQGAGENWFRPVSQSGSGYAFSLLQSGDSSFVLTQHKQGVRELLFTNLYHELVGEWEIVTPEQVLSERKL